MEGIYSSLYVYHPGVYVGTIFAGAFAFGIGFDVGVTKFYDYWNRGVRHQLPEMLSNADINFITETMEGHSS